MSPTTISLLQAVPALLVLFVVWVALGYWVYADAIARGCSDATAFQ